MILYKNIKQLLTFAGVAKKKGRHIDTADLGIIEGASVLVDHENIIKWMGPHADFQNQASVSKTIDSSSEVWLPALVECHTHLVFSGNRAQEFGLRCQGKTYQEIAIRGGGILSTVEATRKATLNELIDLAYSRIAEFEKHQVKVIEIKSGYGLTLESELKILEVIKKLQLKTTSKLIATFMPAHAVPPEFKEKKQDYLKEMTDHWLPWVAKKKLAVFVDCFIEENYFSVAEVRAFCEAALGLGLKLKLHVDQFSDQGGVEFGVNLGATSLDHLEKTTPKNQERIAQSNTVAVLCPGASLFTSYAYPPARDLLNRGAQVALSTDFNPGTCPCTNLPLISTIAATQTKMTIEETVVGITYNAAAALALDQELGTIALGKKLSASRFKLNSYHDLVYQFGNPIAPL